jgi:V8-like Glu-specific endopeptidase
LQIRYSKQSPDDQRWAHCTGWLIEPDLLVTAGHCAFDHVYGFGRAAEVKAYVGYRGRASLGQPDVQLRHGMRALVPQGWMDSDVNRQNDVAFVKLDKQFDDVRPFKFQETPVEGSSMITVVGYPVDQSYQGESGAYMYEQSRKTDFDLTSSSHNMLEHTISVYSGIISTRNLAQPNADGY